MKRNGKEIISLNYRFSNCTRRCLSIGRAKDGQKVPEMTPAIVQSISDRYIELFENITGEKFVKEDTSNIAERIEKNVMDFLTK